MIEQNAYVLKVEGQIALVEAQRQSSCGKCNAKKGCGTGLLEDSIGRKSMQIQAINQCQAEPGDEVIVAIPENGFVKSAFFTYLLPLLFMLAGALLAQQFITEVSETMSDVMALVGAVIGFITALLVLKSYSKRVEKDKQLHPVVIRKLTNPTKIVLNPVLKEHKLF